MSYAPRKTHEESAPSIQESTGEITSDSLAAESLNQGGDFADGHAYVSGQKSTGSTAANTDISGATTLSPAPDAEARLATEEWDENANLNAASRGLGSNSSYGESESGYSSKTKGEYNTTGGTGSVHTVGTAPSGQSRNIDSSSQKPAGSNLQEGGFDEGAPNASYAEVGSSRDPSRFTENEFERRNAEGLVAEGSMGSRSGGVTDQGQYGQLDREEDA